MRVGGQAAARAIRTEALQLLRRVVHAPPLALADAARRTLVPPDESQEPRVVPCLCPSAIWNSLYS